jgi:XTP/dITP diphosphohydrolase
MRTFVATKNTGKLQEMQAIFAGSVLELETYPDYVDVEEGTESYIENAAMKAQTLFRQLKSADIINAAVLADDSGLEVDALGGSPGVLSARYAGENASWKERRKKLLGELANIPSDKRGANFISAMVLVLPDESEITSTGILLGHIAVEERGQGGFGYDPVFVPKGEMRTFSEFSFEEKNAVRHRRRAAEALLAGLVSKE